MDAERFVNEDAPIPAIQALLGEVFDAQRFGGDVLPWQYRANPVGHEIAVTLMQGAQCLAHYAVIPQVWAGDGASHRMALSLNTAVSAQCRGRGLFTDLARATYERAAETRGVSAILGVANANSTPGFLKNLGFQRVAPLPVRAGLVIPRDLPDVAEITPDDLPDSLFSSARHSGGGMVQAWTRESLTWRLASPLTRYRIHLHDSGVLVTCRVLHGGRVPVIVILKILPASEQPVKVGRLLAAAARAHGTPAFVHAGFNDAAPIGGMLVPRRFLPSPLNLIYRRLRDDAPPTFTPACFEFLDFDAY